MRIRHLFRNFFHYSQSEKRGIAVLALAVLVVLLAGRLRTYWNSPAHAEETLHRQALASAACEEFLASMEEGEPPYTDGERTHADEAWVHASGQPTTHRGNKLTPTLFDPNRADSATLASMGLPSWVVRNVLRYRAKGGVFRKPEDFGKMHGLTQAHYQTLLPYIRIAPEERVAKTPAYSSLLTHPDSGAHTDTLARKYPAGTLVELNLADTTELKKIPGVGTHIARSIVNYRQRLGGYYRIEQLQDIGLNHHRLQPWFRVDAQMIRRINLNRSSAERLHSHPYINFYQAKAFVEYRKKRGLLRSLKPFALHEEFSESDLERISHYVCFE